MRPNAKILDFWMLNFKSAFSLSSFIFIKKLFCSSLFSAIRVVVSAYLRLLIFLPAILTPACALSSSAFRLVYSAYKLNKQGDNIQPWRTPFPIWNQPVVPCPILIVASWPAYRFLGRQVSWSGITISLRVFHNVLWSTQSKALAQSIKQMFFWNSLAFSMIQWMWAILSLVPLPFLNPAWTTWISSSRFTYCWSLAWRILSVTLLACEMSDAVLVMMMMVRAQLCPTLCDTTDCSPRDSSMHGISQQEQVGCHVLLQGIFPTQGWNASLLCLLHCRKPCICDIYWK